MVAVSKGVHLRAGHQESRARGKYPWNGREKPGMDVMATDWLDCGGLYLKQKAQVSIPRKLHKV